MHEGYHDFYYGYSDCQLEEFIVEYVDGTMDRSVREVFEEYLAQDPDLADQVCEMRQVRNVMCGLGCGCVAPPGFQSRLRNRLTGEIMRETMARLSGPPRLTRTILFSIVAALAVVGALSPGNLSEATGPTVQASLAVPSNNETPPVKLYRETSRTDVATVTQRSVLHTVNHASVLHTIPVSEDNLFLTEAESGSSVRPELRQMVYCP